MLFQITPDFTPFKRHITTVSEFANFSKSIQLINFECHLEACYIEACYIYCCGELQH